MEAKSYAATIEERDALMKERKELQEELNKIAEQKRAQGVTPQEHRAFNLRRANGSARYRQVCDRLSELKKMLHGAGKVGPGWYEEAFVEVAKRSLPKDVFESLHEAATILYRQRKKERLAEQADTSA